MRLKGKNTPGFLLKDCTHLSSAAAITEQVYGGSSSAASETEKGHMVRTLYIFTLTLCSFDSLVCTITFNKQQAHETELWTKWRTRSNNTHFILFICVNVNVYFMFQNNAWVFFSIMIPHIPQMSCANVLMSTPERTDLVVLVAGIRQDSHTGCVESLWRAMYNNWSPD